MRAVRGNLTQPEAVSGSGSNHAEGRGNREHLLRNPETIYALPTRDSWPESGADEQIVFDNVNACLLESASFTSIDRGVA